MIANKNAGTEKPKGLTPEFFIPCDKVAYPSFTEASGRRLAQKIAHNSA